MIKSGTYYDHGGSDHLYQLWQWVQKNRKGSIFYQKVLVGPILSIAWQMYENILKDNLITLIFQHFSRQYI